MAITPEQQQVLEELLRLVPKNQSNQPAKAGSPALKQTPGVAIPSGRLKTWAGLSGQEVKETLKTMLLQKDVYEQRLLDWIEANPMDASFEFLGIAAWAFYQAERGVNPKVQTYVDALYYITTCASVGYADVFAATQTGRAIAALVMVIGPALTNKTLDRPIPNQRS